MPFSYPDDQKRLWTALRITNPMELLQNSESTLYRLMTERQNFDTKNGITLVDDILEKLIAFEEIEDKISEWLASPNPRNVKSQNSHLEGNIEYDSQSLLSIWRQQKSVLLQEIRSLLDPCGCFAGQYGLAEVIAT